MKKHKLSIILSTSLLALGLISLPSVAKTAGSKEPAIAKAWDINVKPSVQNSYYAAAEGKTGNALKSALAGFNKPTNPSYDWSRYEAADEAQDDSDSILCLYTRHNIGKSSHCGSYSWDKWNREHVFTQSAFPKSDKDNHNIFACEGQINNYRGNKEFAELKGKGGTQVVVFGHTTDCYQNSSYFEPCDEAKGEVARACLYVSVYHSYDLNDIFDIIDTCLKWNANFPVTPREIYRNNIVHGLQGNRNPFIDHPSYAKAIYGGPDYQGTDPLSSAGVTISPTSASVAKGDTVQLTATASDSSPITWTTSSAAIATVSQSGLVTGVKSGTATITASATIDSTVYSATSTITVTAPKTLSSISVSGQKTTYIVGDTFVKPTVTATYSDSSVAVVTNEATFSGYDLSTEGNQTVTVSYTYKGVQRTTSYGINVSAPSPSQIEASVIGDKTFHVGEYINNDDIEVYKDSVKQTNFLFNGSDDYSYQFTYEDALSGGVVTYKTFENAISVGTDTCSLTVKVQRKSHEEAGTVTDVMTASDLPATSTSYTNFSNVSLTSNAKYAGQSAKDSSGRIQLRSKNSNSGIVSTTSGGTITSVRIVVGNGNNTILVFAKNTAYASASDLYNESLQGTQIGSCTSTSTISITDEYQFIGIRSSSGAVYITRIEITYGAEDSAENVANYIMYEDTIGQCNTKTEIAKGYFEELSQDERETFMTSSDYVISSARERFEAWLRNQGESIAESGGDYVVFKNASITFENENNSNFVFVIIISTSILASSLLVGLIIIKKRRPHK